MTLATLNNGQCTGSQTPLCLNFNFLSGVSHIPPPMVVKVMILLIKTARTQCSRKEEFVTHPPQAQVVIALHITHPSIRISLVNLSLPVTGLLVLFHTLRLTNIQVCSHGPPTTLKSANLIPEKKKRSAVVLTHDGKEKIQDVPLLSLVFWPHRGCSCWVSQTDKMHRRFVVGGPQLFWHSLNPCLLCALTERCTTVVTLLPTWKDKPN